ncbi:hypothetical protein [Pseudomonas sp. RIT-PI-S]|uniref:hypothetical protein n=1 Tax=Pseudomonas sp. RIT-PI-S TaxID=3035295 RepID=UPI0021DA15BB|nr:hypothetical protein [Pseudomonas sp. RIT-PI-S]
MSDSERDFSHVEGFEQLAERVYAELLAAMAEHGLSPDLNPDQVYLNGVNNLEERLVIYSESLTYATTRRILEQDPPSPVDSDTDTLGVFFVAYSFADEHRVPDHTPAQVSQAMEAVYFRLV